MTLWFRDKKNHWNTFKSLFVINIKYITSKSHTSVDLDVTSLVLIAALLWSEALAELALNFFPSATQKEVNYKIIIPLNEMLSTDQERNQAYPIFHSLEWRISCGLVVI